MRQLALLGAFGPGAGPPRQQYRALSGSEKAPLPGAWIVGRPNPARQIEVTVLLRPRPAEEPLASLEELGSQPPEQRQHLTREAFASAHGVAPGDVQQVIEFARQSGLRVISRNLAARTLHLSGTIAAFSAAFRVPLSIYRHARGFYRGRSGPVNVPVALAEIVQAVFGLDNRPAARPHFRSRPDLGGVWSHALAASYSPAEVAKLYNFPSAAHGAGQCIGIIELGGGYTARDLNLYFHRLGIPLPQVTSVSVAGGQNRPTGDPNGPDGEVMLDIEVAGAVASGSKIVVYFAPNNNQGFFRAVNRAVHDQVHRPTVVSISWGGPEASWTQQSLTAFDQSFRAAAAIGVTVCAAAGDGGSSDRVPGRLAHADFPASSPFVLACGGTSMQASGGVITSESVWNDGALGGAGGGGISDFFPLPSWQTSAGIPPSVNPAGRTGRGLPDLAGHADESTGYQVRVDDLDTVIGGTSAVAPLTAGLVALCNESLGTNIGFLNPLLYGRLGKNGVFRDITSGNNDMTGHVGGYKAGPGWDACSGFGSPDGAALLAALKTPKHKAAASQGGPSRGDLQAPEKDEGATEGSTATRATRHSKKRA
jgi:kumamolisin